MNSFQAQTFGTTPFASVRSMDFATPGSITKDLTNSSIQENYLQTQLNASIHNYTTESHHINVSSASSTPAPTTSSPQPIAQDTLPVRAFTPGTTDERYTSSGDSSDTDYSVAGVPPVFSTKEDTSFTDLALLQPNKQLEHDYRTYIKEKGLMAFLNKYIPESMTKREICTMIVDFGYSKENIQHYQILTIRETLSILVDLIMNDDTINAKDQEYFEISDIEEQYYTVDDLRHDLTKSSKVLVITGAGISTSLGIPDFRSFQGVYSQLSAALSEPQKVFDKSTFMKDPTLFYSNAHLVLPPEGKYSVLHAFIKLLQDKNKLLRNYTQNIDNLETKAGILPNKLIQCHGSFAEATCITCKNKFLGAKIFDHIRHQQVPRCSTCWASIREAQMSHGVIKPDIVFFGEDLPKKFHRNLHSDVKSCDLVLVIGTSLKVEPVASIIDKVPRRVPRVLINKDPIPDRDFDLSLIGYCDDIVSYLVQGLGSAWDIPHELYNNEEQFEVSFAADLTNTIRISRAL
ncbi:uncharacterized protein SPAPADRAFT_50403 [Spathaspora passalidarum NRRL Y-27907]|uniref:Deacetylase sirtuin-type domain-containing protein n=1 Tax=Spathaspora passalidarum (strain NRRL Y-27907 / 11-Y1) TaxID=619300 RepID=G3AMT6_SPAPN|nr:uncharacterized protein SPAPADRAFT_50403 [Spathaspora passalidarum NRRL Y-27907]EGW33530.1 hypothetical protein SPAPADRAFT_50403 [Spathaspora passalidarum NRRL Y-27907]